MRSKKVWDIEYTPEAEKQLDKLGTSVKARIKRYLETKVAPLENPRKEASKLKVGKYAGYWRFRVGKYRAICDIHDKSVRIVVIRAAKRDEAYRLDLPRVSDPWTLVIRISDLADEFEEEVVPHGTRG
ncbi:MAG: type II toxin-antitoxin system RelE/ParE family toxin [Acidimicrobiia bacterium]|nr:type II toxin-antitoxin system RelE/ParE family toxin [bacterium]MXZ07374.1 type II toxin-antitoxin system RelE/ParE family toxin [Acidimicrobiia bacterium]MCY3580812.1 type II toxin-antitoxin system RelE/ParE family toxin [bacterium]MDE0643170.1 type II toxin-antitoxin system RelE/ParE family toxin [bacterium]MYD04662.1 type II toxin-antitoxin system RelE/ParE family toxin [Acidimicrobiia bacterium]